MSLILISRNEAIVLSAFKGREQLHVPDLALTGREYKQAIAALVRRGWLKNTRLPLTLTKSSTLKNYLNPTHTANQSPNSID